MGKGHTQKKTITPQMFNKARIKFPAEWLASTVELCWQYTRLLGKQLLWSPHSAQQQMLNVTSQRPSNISLDFYNLFSEPYIFLALALCKFTPLPFPYFKEEQATIIKDFQ